MDPLTAQVVIAVVATAAVVLIAVAALQANVAVAELEAGRPLVPGHPACPRCREAQALRRAHAALRLPVEAGSEAGAP